jgi:hypothetical protein
MELGGFDPLVQRYFGQLASSVAAGPDVAAAKAAWGCRTAAMPYFALIPFPSATAFIE